MDPQHPEAEPREERGIRGEARQPACATRRQRHDAERDQRVQGKEQEDGDGFKEYSHEGDVGNPKKVCYGAVNNKISGGYKTFAGLYCWVSFCVTALLDSTFLFYVYTLQASSISVDYP